MAPNYSLNRTGAPTNRSIKTTPEVLRGAQSKKEIRDRVAALKPPDENIALTESELSNVLLESFKGIFRLSNAAHVNLGTHEIAQMPEIPELRNSGTGCDS